MRHRHRKHGRLVVRVYWTLLTTILLTTAVVSAISWAVRDGPARPPTPLARLVGVLARDLPTEGPSLDAALEQRADELEADLTLFASDGTVRAHAGPALPPSRTVEGPHWAHDRKRGPILVVPLPDGGALAAADRHGFHGPRVLRGLVMILFFLGVLLVAAVPVARRITRRLERLGAGVERFGEGDLTARIEVEGHDEVARLAEQFNAAAERIESLVKGQSRVLMSASHELRSPLARLGMALTMLADGTGDREKHLAEARADIAALDDLIEDLLTAARLEHTELVRAPVDLGALARRVAQQTPVHGEATVSGDARLLERALTNLLENARRHGGGEGVEVVVDTTGDEAVVAVLDRGPGVDETDRERIFEPFYRPQGHAEGADGGVGVGLSLVRHIAEHHGGTARCLPREGGGSRFEVRLPRG